MADLMGDLMGDGYYEEIGEGSEGGEEMGARLSRARAVGRTLRLPPRPAWRAGLAPGVQMPRESLEPLVLIPQQNNGIFTSTVTSITYTARPQRPFRAERPVVTVARSGPSAQGVFPVARGGFLVGTTVQQAQVADLPLEIFAPTAFDVRLALSQAEPGVEITANCGLTGPLTSTDTLTLGIALLGRSIQA